MPLKQFFNHQIELWEGRGKLGEVDNRELNVGKFSVTLQHNPARIVSTGAKVDNATISQRKCFLCASGRLPHQEAIPIELAGEQFDILVNPYPILPYHFTIAARRHTRQQLAGRIGAFAQLLEAYPGLTVFYNGPRSGASAPDHLHFQASLSANLPLQRQWDELAGIGDKELRIAHFISPFFAIETTSAPLLTEKIVKVVASLPIEQNDYEPRLNLIAWHDGAIFKAAIFPRRSHRPECYYHEGDDQLMVSPGALDMAGLIVTPRSIDFERITAYDINQIMGECGSDAAMPLSVGITHKARLSATFAGEYTCCGHKIDGNEVFSIADGQVLWRGQTYSELLFMPQRNESTFTLRDVEIGTRFHWQQLQEETFRGSLRIMANGDELIAVNIIDAETYLESVVGSEMSATSATELLKAHAVISRSWVMAQVCRGESATTAKERGQTDAHKRIVWYDHEAHTLFDVCADDHCQRYQGIPNESAESAAQAVRATRGETLTYKGRIADARFSKCCGGATELFSCCWADEQKPYLPAQIDAPGAQFRPINTESAAKAWIMGNPKTFCGMANAQTLRQSLNGYDQPTQDYYRWSVRIEQEELRRLLREKIGFDHGPIKELLPLERGASGRISLLRIVAADDYIDIGKELEIRRVLSPTHLLSSAFIVTIEKAGRDDVPSVFVLHGAGWGHGVGLCQIGAAEMAALGYNYQQILRHYYRCEITRLGISCSGKRRLTPSQSNIPMSIAIQALPILYSSKKPLGTKTIRHHAKSNIHCSHRSRRIHACGVACRFLHP